MNPNKFIRKRLIPWYLQNKRELPWRNTTDPYIIWLSEIILQQTRVAQGLPYFYQFVNEFPTVFHLAKADQGKVLRIWQGLGYYSRARNLHACAIIIVDDHNGEFPTNYSELLKLPGVGQYTAAAIASFAFREAVPVVDGNVYRVLARIFNLTEDIDTSRGQKAFKTLAWEVMDKQAPHLYNQAIMEFGALQCTPRSPGCDQCIFSDECRAKLLGFQAQLPVKSKKVKVKSRYFHYLVFYKDDRIGMKSRKSGDIWQGLYDFYLLENQKPLNETRILDHLTRILVSNSGITLTDVSDTHKHILTHQRIFARFFHFKIDKTKNPKNPQKIEQIEFYSKDEIKHLPKPILIANYLNEHIF